MRSYWERAKVFGECSGCKAQYLVGHGNFLTESCCTEEDNDGKCYFYDPREDEVALDEALEEMREEALAAMVHMERPLAHLSRGTSDGLLVADVLYRRLYGDAALPSVHEEER